MSESNFARKWVNKKSNKKNIICEPSGVPYGEVEDKWNLIRELLKSKER